MAKRGTLDSPKNEMLAATLGTDKGLTFGCLETIWQRAAQYYQTGRVTKAQLTTILRTTGWLKVFTDEAALIEALTNPEHTWLDRLPDGSFFIHDWHEHCDDSVHAYLYRKVQCFANGVEPRPRKINKPEREELDPKWAESRAGRTLDAQQLSGSSPISCPVLSCHSPVLSGQVPSGSMPPEPAPPPSFVNGFPEDVQAKAVEVFTRRWFDYKGCLPNYHQPDARQELREIADRIYSDPNGYEKLSNYFAKPPPPHLGRTPKLWRIFKHLFEDSAHGKQRRDSGSNTGQSAGGGQYEGLKPVIVQYPA